MGFTNLVQSGKLGEHPGASHAADVVGIGRAEFRCFRDAVISAWIGQSWVAARRVVDASDNDQ